MKICYITSQTPYGKGEQFILPEIRFIRKKGHGVIIIPVRPEKDLALGKEAEEMKNITLRYDVLNLKIFLKSLKVFIINPLKVLTLVRDIFIYSNGFKKIIKNLAVLPKGLYISEQLKESGVEHIHCHWISTSSTMGYIASKISNIPFSITSHRWDIAENNMLIPKARNAKFIRVIDEPGYREVIDLIGEKYGRKCIKVHVGVDIKDICRTENHNRKNKEFTIVTAANFVEKKGHIYLIQALNEVRNNGHEFKTFLYGDGPLENKLKEKISEYSLDDKIIFGGKIAHDSLLKKYYSGDIDCFILPSIVASDGDKEGIPVSLMEAMAARIPVISTNTGGISELVDGTTGININQKDYKALAEAIEKIITDDSYRATLIENGEKRVRDEFHIDKVTDKLIGLFKE